LPGTSNGQGASWPVEPYDADAWLTRYVYDLSGGGTVSLRGSSSFHAYGNLYKTQSWLAGDLTIPSGWTDQRGSAFDALDREITKFAYQVASSGNGAITTTQLQYDTGSNPAPGLLTSKTNPNSEVVAYIYDEHSHVRSQTYSGEGGATPNETYTYDPNGRMASIASSVFGTEQETYDTDGRLWQVQEPSGGGVNSPAQLTYSYYGNGEKSALSIASSSLTQTNALAYSYRTDGALQTQAVSAVGAAGAWTKTYTDGGRLTAVSGVDAQSRTYDTTGQLAAYSSASGSVTLSHDPEGSPLSEAFPSVRFIGMSPIAATESHIYNVRGELLQTTMIDSAGATHSATRSVTNSGFLTGDASINGTGESNPADVLNGVALGASSMSSTTYNDQIYPTGSSNSFSFDASGRLSSQVNLVDSFTQVQNPSDGSTHTSATSLRTTTTFGYDAENRTHSQAGTLVRTATNPDTGATTKTTTNFPTKTIGWGPNGHPILAPNLYTSSQGNVTFHWDGDIILFITDAGGNVIDFKIGLDGDITPQDANFKGITAYDRDSAGVIVQSQNATGLSGYGPSDPSTLADPAGTTPGFQQAVTPAGYGRPDGFYIGLVEINGVRAFHPDLGSWTTPDAYEGDVHDPTSQQRYMWNRGNPIDYSDPSGYSAQALIDGLRALGEGVLQAIGETLMRPVPSSWPMSGGACSCGSAAEQPKLSGGKASDPQSSRSDQGGWRRASPGEVKGLIKRGLFDPHGKGAKAGGSRDDIFIDRDGNYGVGNKDGSGEVEIHGNVHDEPAGGSGRSKPKDTPKGR
jgi:YD repeat-containing protein